MKLVSKSTIARFSNQTYSFQSMMELMGRQPYHIAGYIRLKKQYSMGLLAITEALGNVYMEDGASYTKLKEIDTYSFTWDVEVEQIPTVRFTRSNTDTGSTGSPVTLYLESRYFSKYDVFALENTQLVYVLEEPERVADNEFKYTCKPILSSGLGLDVRFTAEQKTARYTHNLHPEFSEYGTNKVHYNLERHINYLMKIRAGQKFSSDFRATQDLYFMSDADIKKAQDVRGGSYQVFKMPTIEQQVLDHFLKSANGALLFNRSTMDEETGRPFIQLENNQDVIGGDGIIAQYERYAYNIDYSKLSVKNFQEAIEYISDKRGMSQGNHVTVICNRIFSRQKASALQDAITLFAPQNNGTWFFTKDDPIAGVSDEYGGMKRMKKVKVPNEVAVGATFNTYIYEGNTVTFIVDEALTNHYRDRGYALFIDTGIYEDENGQIPAVHLKTLKGRALVKNTIPGMGGVDGTSDGVTNSALDAGNFQVLGWRGACVRNPYAAVIFEENI